MLSADYQLLKQQTFFFNFLTPVLRISIICNSTNKLLHKSTYSLLLAKITYIILARNRKLPDDDVLTSEHVAASYIYFHVII